MPLTPNNREEHWLQGMVDGQTTLEPNKRREYWYKEIVDAIGSGGGGGGSVLVCTLPNEGNTLDKTWKEIHDAFPSSVVVLISNGDGYSQMHLATSIGFADDLYYVGFTFFGETEVSTRYYSVATENGYPEEEFH